MKDKKQLKLKFDWRKLLIDTRFEKYDVDLYRPGGKIATSVSGIWAINPTQAKVKAIKRINGKGYSIEESRAFPLRGP